jgi:hypothetical protein
MVANLKNLLDSAAYQILEQEIERNTISLFRLGEDHFTFAKSVHRTHWRQKISRCYYGAYNVRRAVRLYYEGHFRTDVSDHKQSAEFPNGFPNAETYKVQLGTLRDDRNLADYEHDATENDLILSVMDAERLTQDFINDARSFLKALGVKIGKTTQTTQRGLMRMK